MMIIIININLRGQNEELFNDVTAENKYECSKCWT